MQLNNFQRLGSISNTHAGRDFEAAVKSQLARMQLAAEEGFAVEIGGKIKKLHKFDFGVRTPPALVECKSYTWTSGGNSPSAKIRGLNEAMLLFSVAPAGYRKMLFMLRHVRQRGFRETLAEHYVRTQGHLIPEDVEIWELDPEQGACSRVV